MADRTLAYAENVPGGFFVDSTCIDCDTCRQVAPASFVAVDGHSAVGGQPRSEGEARAAARAVLCCPTNSIGSDQAALVRAASADFPLPITGDVAYCGFAAASSFGASSYFIRHADGNWLIDAPRWTPQLVQAIARAGGLSGIFLTHRDDVADAARYAQRFGARRVIHARDADAMPGAEQVLTGEDETALATDLVAIPTPGHTAGHCAALWRGTHLFSGDHLWWSRRLGALNASREVCWHSWTEQTASVRRLAQLACTWVLPGHGERRQMTVAEYRAGMHALVERMGRAPEEVWP
jgi:glyoxylase-like metal-dependent hydrolase (beta-lactamase superfamily II)/ferredoxin